MVPRLQSTKLTFKLGGTYPGVALEYLDIQLNDKAAADHSLIRGAIGNFES